jgi:hypothetical protein
MRHQRRFQQGAEWCVMIRVLEFCSARKNKAWTVGFPVMLQLHVFEWGTLLKLLGKTPQTYD